jgi:hypothetical protein
LACVPSLPIAFSTVSRLYSTFSPPHRNKQTMTRWMNDQTIGRLYHTKNVLNDATRRLLLYVISWRIWVSFGGFFEDYIFAWWNIWVYVIL